MAADISDYVGTGMGEEKGKAFSSWEQEGALLPACPPSSPWGERVPDTVSRHSLSSCSSCFCLCLEEQEKLRGQRKQEKSNTWLTAALKAAGSLPETPPKALRVLSPREEKNTKNKLLKHCPGEAFDPERKILWEEKARACWRWGGGERWPRCIQRLLLFTLCGNWIS